MDSHFRTWIPSRRRFRHNELSQDSLNPLLIFTQCNTMQLIHLVETWGLTIWKLNMLMNHFRLISDIIFDLDSLPSYFCLFEFLMCLYNSIFPHCFYLFWLVFLFHFQTRICLYYNIILLWAFTFSRNLSHAL